MTRYTWKRITDDNGSYHRGVSTDPQRPGTVKITKTRDGWVIEGGRGARFSTLEMAKQDAEWCLEQQPKTPKPAEAPSTRVEAEQVEQPADAQDAIPTAPLLSPTEAGQQSTEWQKVHMLGELVDEAARIREAERRIKKLVDEARAKGATWAEVGAALDLSLQGAHKRYGKKSWKKPPVEGDAPMF